MSDFKNAKIGDRLYSLRFGWVEVLSVNYGYPYVTNHILCSDTHKETICWRADGRLYEQDVTQDLYWGKPEIIAPEKPKRKVKAYLYASENGTITTFFHTDTSAYTYHGECVKTNATKTPKHLTRTKFFIEVEE